MRIQTQENFTIEGGSTAAPSVHMLGVDYKAHHIAVLIALLI